MDTMPSQDWKTDSPIKQVLSAFSPIGQKFANVVGLELEDGERVFGCAHCPLVTATFQGITAHHLRRDHGIASRSANGGRNGPTRGSRTISPDFLNMTMGDVIAKLKASDGDRDEWRRRALDAERKLAAMKRALS